MPEVYKIVKGSGGGGFLHPPGDPAHAYSIVSYSSNRRNARETGFYGLDSTAEWLPKHIRDRAREILDRASREPSELWIRSVYGYFRNMWTTDGVMWTSVADLVSSRPEDAPADWHAATVYVRKWFPDHEARTDLIVDPGKGYGSYPCDRCGKRVQYESRFDALTVVTTRSRPGGGTDWAYEADCIGGGKHEVS